MVLCVPCALARGIILLLDEPLLDRYEQTMLIETLTELYDAFARSGYEHVEDFLEHEVDVETLRRLRTAAAIEECGEPLVPVPENLVLADPHPYVKAGAPYGRLSPWQVRASVAERLQQVQVHLDALRPGYKLYIHDAYRPLSVQVYMIEYECQRLAREQLLDDFHSLDQQHQARIRSQVRQFWAKPNDHPSDPPPHSTGAAVDVTIVDATGAPLNMGAPIDDLTERAYPNYYAEAALVQDKVFHRHRELLHRVMRSSGFIRNPIEWWHFSYGDQAWAFLETLAGNATNVSAVYGRVECQVDDV